MIILLVIVKLGNVWCNFVNFFEKCVMVYLCFICFNILLDLDCSGICKWCIILFEFLMILIILLVSWFVLIEEICICLSFLIVFKFFSNCVRL